MARRAKSIQGVKGGISTPSWVGDTGDLKDLIEIGKALEKRVQDESRREHLESTEERRKLFYENHSSRSLEYLLEDWNEENTYSLDQKKLEIYLELSTNEGSYSRKREGDPDDVLTKIKPSDVKRLELSLHEGSYFTENPHFFTLTLDRDRGCELTCSGPNDDWVILVEEKFKPLLKAQSPWYRWLRRLGVSVPIVWLPMTLIFMYIVKTLSRHQVILRSGDWINILVLSAGAALIAAYIVIDLLQKLIPAFELSAKGEKTQVAHRIALLATGFFWILGTVVIPFLLFN